MKADFCLHPSSFILPRRVSVMANRLETSFADRLVTSRLRFLEGAEQALDPSGPKSAAHAETLRDLHAQIGAQAMEIQALQKRLGER
jgi:hypothetical protein